MFRSENSTAFTGRFGLVTSITICMMIAITVMLLFVGRSESVSQTQTDTDDLAYLPAIHFQPTLTPTPTPTPSPTPMPSPTPPADARPEIRGMWVSRFDWTSSFTAAQPEKIDEIVDNAALAGINLIYFQVRGTADAFYTPGDNLEPWSQRMTAEKLGDDPGWDPLARLIEKAHAQNIQVHAYINVYPVWIGCNGEPPADTSPQHLFHRLDLLKVDELDDVLQTKEDGGVYCSSYKRISPASEEHDAHLLRISDHLITNYDIDGIHLDHIRYANADSSYDKHSNAEYEKAREEKFITRANWQRSMVNGTVDQFYSQLVGKQQKLWLSAAVWPVYHDYWGWEVGQGYDDYYQDSKSWVQQGYIDTISPMIYPAQFSCPANRIDDSFWSLTRWETLVRDFHASRGSRHVIPGIGTGYCSFADIENRINKAREIGTLGHSLFSYKGLLQTENGKTYFELLREGPYQNSVPVPELTWHD